GEVLAGLGGNPKESCRPRIGGSNADAKQHEFSTRRRPGKPWILPDCSAESTVDRKCRPPGPASRPQPRSAWPRSRLRACNRVPASIARRWHRGGSLGSIGAAPAPAADLGHVLAMLPHIGMVLFEHALDHGLDAAGLCCEPGDLVDDGKRQVEAI